MHSILLQATNSFDVAQHSAQLIDSAGKVTPESMWGYTFAVSLLLAVIIGMVYVLRLLWGRLESKDHEYVELANSTARVLSEISMKLDIHDELKQKLEKVIDIVQDIKRDHH